MIRVVIVDDSSTMRSLLKRSLSHHSDIVVVGEADHPLEARQVIKDLNPDVLTLDIEMPQMSGLEFLEKVMRLRPMPVIIVSTLTRRGAQETVDALALGAFDCIEKPSPGNENSFDGLAGRIRLAAQAKGKLGASRQPTSPPQQSMELNGNMATPRDHVIAIGASTGGVEALQAILAHFPADCPPTIIVQHMPPTYTNLLAERLNRHFSPTIVQASDGMRLEPGKIMIAPGGERHFEIAERGGLTCILRDGGRVNHHCPSIDVMFRSVARVCGRQSIGVLLTGMGADGAEGLKEMRQAGATTVAQDEATSIVYGMPRVAWEIAAAERQLPLHKIASAVLMNGKRTLHDERLIRP